MTTVQTIQPTAAAPSATTAPKKRYRLPRYRTYAERLGPTNAKSIILHYLAVVFISYIIWTVRGWVVDVSVACGDPQVEFGHWAAHLICMLGDSNNILVLIVRKYLDFTSYYLVLIIMIVNTFVILVLAKHLWKAFWVKDHKQRPKDNGSVVIDIMEEECGVVCIDDNFCIEVILAAFDFFRVSETKQD